MAKEKAPETDAASPPGKAKRKLSLKKILILAVLGLVLAGGGLVAYIIMVDEPPTGTEAHAGQSAAKHRVNMPLDPFLVNLADRETRRYLKLKLELEVDDEATARNWKSPCPASGTPSSSS
jgi:flagellar protein FliL